jgi:hypothetical protein
MPCKLSSLLVFLVSPFALLYAQTQYPLKSDPVSLALAGCKTTLSHEWSPIGNPAGMASLMDVSVAALYETRYNLPELSTRASAITIPSRWGVVSVLYSSFGFDVFHTDRYGLAYARKFGQKVSAGFQFNYWNEFQQLAGYHSTFLADAGLIFHPSEKLVIGVHAFNPSRATINNNNSETIIPASFSTGLSWRAIKYTHLFLETTLNQNAKTDIMTAMETNIQQKVKLRGGYSFVQQRISWGVGCYWKPIKCEIGFSHEQPLGLITSASLAFMVSTARNNLR